MLKTLAKSIREYKKPSLLAPLFMIGEVAGEVIIPYLMALLIDNGFSSGELGYIFKIGGLMVLATFMSLFFGVLSAKNAAVASVGLAKNLRHDMYFRVQDFSFRNIDRFSTASLITRMTTDVTNIQNAYQMIIRMLVRAPIMVVFSFVMAAYINVSLSLIFLIAIPFLAVAIYYMSTSAHKYFTQMFKVYDRLNRVVQENLIGIRTVKAYVREEHEIEKFRTESDGIRDLSSRAERVMVWMNPLMFGTVYVCTVLCCFFGARFIIAGELQTGELMSVITYTMQMLMSLMMVSMVLVMCVMSKASADRIVEVLREESNLTNGENPITEVPDGSISFENVQFGYSDGDDKAILRNINLTIPSGSVVGIIGGTGSSKSSLVQLIPRLYDPQKGSVKVGGIDVREYDLETLRNAVSMVLQKNELFSGTIKDNLRWGNENASDEEIIQACQLAQASEFVEKMDGQYDAYIEQGGRNVSGGQKQRLCIARALLKSPKILILDDSTSAVDTTTDARIQEGFQSFIPDTTKIIIAQRISSVERADMIIVLNEGEINGIGTHEELMQNNEIYRDVYEAQTKGVTE